jgi:hypothetical protein
MYTLGQCMIRHTKKQTLGGEEVLSLPPLQHDDVAGENFFYNSGLPTCLDGPELLICPPAWAVQATGLLTRMGG